jgi:hypothetical protein
LSEPTIHFKLHRPSGERINPPSIELMEALQCLSKADEMQPLLSRARTGGRDIMIEVFHSADGQPLLIHTALYPNLTS